jgi:molybdate transport system substrate-binding protein
MWGLALAMVPAATVRAADLQVLAGGGIAEPLRALSAQFENSTGHKLVLRFGTTPELVKLSTSGNTFDVAVAPSELFKDAAAAAQFAPGPTTEIARVGLGVAVRAGAPRPDISTPAALKQALLNAQSIATVPESAAGTLVLRVFERLGISDTMKAKTKALTAAAQIVQSVAQGDAELGVFLSNVLTAPGVDLVGTLPAELQQEIVYTASVAANGKESEAARAFIRHLTTPAAAALLKAKGMEPPRR